MAAYRVEQKLCATFGDRHAEMVGDRFMHGPARGPAKGGGQVDARLQDGGGRVHAEVSIQMQQVRHCRADDGKLVPKLRRIFRQMRLAALGARGAAPIERIVLQSA